MFGIGFTELVIIAIVALVAVGPEKIPGLARTIGRMTWELRRAWEDVRETVREEMSEVREPIDELRRAGTKTLQRVRRDAEQFRRDTADTVQSTRRELQAAVKPLEAATPAALAAAAALPPDAGSPAAALPADAAAPVESAAADPDAPQPFQRKRLVRGMIYYDLDGNPVDQGEGLIDATAGEPEAHG